MKTFDDFPGVQRYLTADNRQVIKSLFSVHDMDWDEIRAFYLKFQGPQESGVIAAFGLIDRYFLLTRLLNRVDMGHPWLYERCREVEAEPDWCLDVWAREHRKTTIITQAGGIQEILRDPEQTVAIFSHTRPISRAFLRLIKQEFESNGVLKTVYADVLYGEPKRQSPKWSEEDGLLVKRKSNRKEATLEAWGLVDGQPTSRHYGLRIYDDVVVKESVSTPEQVQKTIEALDLSDNLGSVGGRAWFVGTFYSFGDPYHTLIDRKYLTVRIHPATDNGRLDGTPVLWPQDYWEMKKKTQPTTISSQCLCNPAADNDAMFKMSWLRGYELRPMTMNVYIMGDPSRGQTKRSDRTAFAVIGVDAQMNKYLLDGMCHRMNLSERWLNLRLLYSKWRAERGVLNIGVGYERYGMQTDLEYFEERMIFDKVYFSIDELAWPKEGGHSKEDRVERLVPDVKNGSFFLPSLIRHETFGISTWAIEEENIVYKPLIESGQTAHQRRAEAEGRGFLAAKPIVRRNEIGKPYDVAASFIEEYRYFPFSRFDDMIDVVSRIYDMEPTPPRKTRPDYVEPEVFYDS